MSTYNAAAVSNTTIAYEKPITLQQGRALRDNPVAIAEGAPNAPYMQSVWHPYDGYARGDGADGVLWDFDTDGPIAVLETPTFADGFEYRFLFFMIANALSQVQVDVFRQTDAAYGGTPVDFFPRTLSKNMCEFTVYAPMIARNAHLAETVAAKGGGGNSLSFADITDAYKIGISHATAQKISKVKFSASYDIEGAGAKIIMEKRLADGSA